MLQVTYNPAVFDVTSLAEAQNIILTPEEGLPTSDRWNQETPYLGEVIEYALNLNPHSLVLDYGCGVGRLSRALIQSTGCTVIGVDISANMRVLAQRYVDSPRFTAVSPELLDALVQRRGLLFDAALSVWVLQHCWKVEEDVERLHRSLSPGGGLYVVNENRRCVPSAEVAWVDDDKNVPALLRERFREQSCGRLDPSKVSKRCYENAFWGVYGA